jgi:hypothetical protein
MRAGGEPYRRLAVDLSIDYDGPRHASMRACAAAAPNPLRA